ncbi:YqgQ family protein [Sutcliffiella horikoshii]|uniref:YqgQ family protein n=1 Tax=Sutcliffiella horikoshii TaxID=79883 RepID=UPI0007D0B29B|nr:YqgQ family protein [Sutcliffiella horikoshii]MCM3617813.1 YqgQ family protein [Sutcliffiella horikoshii]
MKTMYDVRQLLRKYGTFIYTGDKVADIEMMEDEIRELYRSGVLEPPLFQSAMMLLRQELSKLR